MKILRAPLALALLFVLAGATVAFAETPAPGSSGNQAAPATPNPAASLTIVGQITNATPGGSLPVTTTVSLYAIDGQSLAFSLEGTADKSGQVRFENVASQPGRGYGLAAVVGSVQYPSELVRPKAGEKVLTVPLRIYDTTKDNSGLRVGEMYVVGQFVSENRLQVINAYLMSNEGDRTVEGAEKTADGKPATLRFYLPAGAQNVEFQGDSSKFSRTADGFVTAMGIPPGNNVAQVLLSYTLPYTGQLHLETRAPYPVQKVQVLMANQGVTLTSPLLTDAGTNQTGQDGVARRAYTGNSLARGQSLIFDLKGTPRLLASAATAQSASGSTTTAAKPGRDAQQDNRRLIGEGIIMAGLLAILAACIWRLVTLRKRDMEPMGEHRALYEALADLDEEHEAGKIPDSDYANQREFLKAALLAALQSPALPPEAATVGQA